MPSRRLSAAAVAAASALVLTGCASAQAGGSDDGRIDVITSTNVYGQLVEEIAGDLVDVTSIITSTAQDPHSFEASAQDQLAVADADLIIENGGGYDAFIDALIESSGSEAKVLTAVEFSSEWPGGSAHEDSAHEDGAHGDGADDSAHADSAHEDGAHEDGEDSGEHAHEHVEGFNEHVWYDPAAMSDLVLAISSELSILSPGDADAFEAAADALAAEITALEASLADIESAYAGEQVFVTEPIPYYLMKGAGLTDVTPPAFSEAVEEGMDVAPATLLESIRLLEGGDVRVVFVNAQTGGGETTQVIDEASANSIPVVEFTETLPEGQTYLSWMQDNIAAIQDALEE